MIPSPRNLAVWFDVGKHDKPAQARNRGILVEEWAFARLPFIMLDVVPKELGHQVKVPRSGETLTLQCFDISTAIIRLDAEAWELNCHATHVPSDWCQRDVSHWPVLPKAEASQSWYRAGNHDRVAQAIEGPREWVFHRPFWVLYEKLSRELTFEYERREKGDPNHRSTKHHRGPLIEGLSQAFHVTLTGEGYGITCSGLQTLLKKLPYWDAFG